MPRSKKPDPKKAVVVRRPEPKGPGGRPSKYDQAYCEALVKHMGQGLSFESFAAVIRVNQDTLHEWVKRYPEFSEAKKEAWALNQLFWEKVGLTGMAGKIPGFNATVWIFNMKNRFKWRDIQPPEESTREKDYEQTFRSAIEELKREKKK